MEKKSGLKKRVIPVILFYNYQIVKSREFKDYRIFGNLEQTIAVFNQRKVDELVILDIGASKQKTGVNLMVLKTLSRNSIMPLTYGGGIHTIDEIQQCLSAGCDKVVINSECIQNPDFITKAANTFGSQCIVASIDYTTHGKKQWKVFSHSELPTDHLKAETHAQRLAEIGAGELLITSVDHDGQMEGYDHDLLRSIMGKVNIPILVNGGCGHPQHIAEILKTGASGGCASSVFYYSEFGYKDIKTYLQKENIQVRIS